VLILAIGASERFGLLEIGCASAFSNVLAVYDFVELSDSGTKRSHDIVRYTHAVCSDGACGITHDSLATLNSAD
jgi:hypothetical protein